MEFKRSDDGSAIGTSLQGYINIDKRLLVKFFGEPIDFGPGDKVMNEWCLEITDNSGTSHIVTIYDWKQYVDKLPEDFDNWHVGGASRMAPCVLSDLLLELAKKTDLPSQSFRGKTYIRC